MCFKHWKKINSRVDCFVQTPHLRVRMFLFITTIGELSKSFIILWCFKIVSLLWTTSAALVLGSIHLFILCLCYSWKRETPPLGFDVKLFWNLSISCISSYHSPKCEQVTSTGLLYLFQHHQQFKSDFNLNLKVNRAHFITQR